MVTRSGYRVISYIRNVQDVLNFYDNKQFDAMSPAEAWQKIAAATQVHGLDDLLALPTCQADTSAALQRMLEHGQQQLACLDRDVKQMEVGIKAFFFALWLCQLS
jgi:hypothetical protein